MIAMFRILRSGITNNCTLSGGGKGVIAGWKCSSLDTQEYAEVANSTNSPPFEGGVAVPIKKMLRSHHSGHRRGGPLREKPPRRCAPPLLQKEGSLLLLLLPRIHS